MENRTRRSEHEVLYVYDRICPKESKKRELYKEYGVKRNSNSGGKPGAQRSGMNRGRVNPMSGERRDGAPRQNRERMRPNSVHGGDTLVFDRIPKTAHGGTSNGRRARPGTSGSGDVRRNERARTDGRRRPEYKSASTDARAQNERAHAYTYRPESPREGTETALLNPIKLLLAKVITFFETVNERGRRDEMSAKRQAVARKKLYEHRHAIGTALLVLLILIGFVFLVYKTFFVITNIDAVGSTTYTESAIIAASGINEGDNLYSFSVTDAEGNITFHCPYIKSVDITRTMPNTVSIAVSEDTAMYVCEIWGERILLSSGLRVLGYADADSSKGLPELCLPTIDYSVAGRVVAFSDTKSERYVREVLSAIQSDAYFSETDIDRIDLSASGDIQITISGKYILKLGTDSDCARKLRMAEKTLNDTTFDRTKPATIDLTKVGEASVRYDPKLFNN